VKDIVIQVEDIVIQVEGIDLQVEHLSAEHFHEVIWVFILLINPSKYPIFHPINHQKPSKRGIYSIICPYFDTFYDGVDDWQNEILNPLFTKFLTFAS